MEKFSLAGFIGALFGLVIGLIDYRILTGILRARLRERRTFASAREQAAAERRLDRLFQVVFLFTIVAFAALGYWFGAEIGGGLGTSG